MPVPVHIFDPPFNIIRASHVVLDVTNLDTSREFYETAIGLHVEDRDDDALYLRGSEEHQHHSLVLRKAPTAACNRLGFKVGNDGDLDKAASFFSENGIAYAFTDGTKSLPTEIARGSMMQWRIDGLPDASARSNAGANSSVRSTRSPWPPNALAYIAKSGFLSWVPTTRPG